MNRHARQPGFTLAELLVAISITVLMLLLISRIFFDTTNAVSLGVATGQVVESSRAISDQIERDANTMVGVRPSDSPPGFLIILKNTIATAMAHPDGTETTELIQDDQLMFITGPGSYTAMAPGSITSYSNTATAIYARVWYGHGQRVNSDGTDGGTLGATPNRLGNQWILCRQATLLAGAPPGVGVYATDATETSGVNGYTLPAGISANAWEGLSDVASQDFTTSLTGLPQTLTYPAGAYAYTYGTQRLRVNPVPLKGPSYYDSWRIAQGHPYLMGGVSDFEVTFAADLDNDGNIDTDVSGNIIWYGNSTPASPAADFSWSAKNPYAAGPVLTNATTAAYTWHHDDSIPFAGSGIATNSTWPYLIRIRYRLHDIHGRLQSTLNGNAVSGRWFEQIIKVNRPTP